ncbi:uncharacterized protein V2V93DRAFT_376116 [Kockiozyma suomiensis]|uniref:uncharacterized protein n=1 Tax=Kockiozyma suomiensis TaxID=1337062 RepID=UPI0033430D96
MASTSVARGRQPISLAEAAHAAEQQLSQKRLRRSSAISSDDSDSSFSSSDEASIYQAEVYIDLDASDSLSYVDHLPDKDETSKLYPANTNGSYINHIAPDESEATSIRSQRRHSVQNSATGIIINSGANAQSFPSSNNGTNTGHSTAAVGSALRHGHGDPRNRNSIVLGSPSSGNMFRSIDYSEYTYDLGWTAASRVHSRTSSVFQMPAPQVGAGQNFVGSPGFASPAFLASRGVVSGDGDSIVSHLDNFDAQSASVVANDDEVPASSGAQPITIAGSPPRGGEVVETSEDAHMTTPLHIDDLAASPPVSFVNITCSADGVCDYPDTDLATLIDYASPRVPPFPSTAEAEELLYTRMSAQSRAALHKLMHGRNPSVPRPPRFRPPISQNMGYGAISRHPFYHSSRSSSNARSIDSQSGRLSRQPSRAPEPAYRRRAMRDANNAGEFGSEDLGFWESFKSFFVSEFCFCFTSGCEAHD